MMLVRVHYGRTTYWCSLSGMAWSRPFDSSHTRENSLAWYLMMVNRRLRLLQ